MNSTKRQNKPAAAEAAFIFATPAAKAYRRADMAEINGWLDKAYEAVRRHAEEAEHAHSVCENDRAETAEEKEFDARREVDAIRHIRAKTLNYYRRERLAARAANREALAAGGGITWPGGQLAGRGT